MVREDSIALEILLVDDDEAVRQALGDHLRKLGHEVALAQSGDEALQLLKGLRVDVVITDVRMPRMDGFELLARVKQWTPEVEVIVVTAYGDVDNAVRALREGAFDFFTKPFNIQQITAALERTGRYKALQRENQRFRQRMDLLDAEGRERYGLAAIAGDSAVIREARELIVQVAASESATVLVSGETGTGKELAARAIHYESGRAGGSFVAVDCTAIPEHLIESELFGHVRGAFTDARSDREGKFELADGGTLFLDEIGDMAVEMQRKLLRTLEERKVQRLGENKERSVDVRVVSATNRDLRAAIDEGAFREDLFHRLNTIEIRMPPLRERREDIRPLAQRFLGQLGRETRKEIAGFSEAALARLEAHNFPGNVRELRNIVERAVILCRGGEIGAEELQFEVGAVAARDETDAEDLDLARNEERLIRRALDSSEGSKTEAAKLLGVTRDSLRRRLDRHGIE